jgi:hypothetical protein
MVAASCRGADRKGLCPGPVLALNNVASATRSSSLFLISKVPAMPRSVRSYVVVGQ